jgi:hypothetical protein
MSESDKPGKPIEGYEAESGQLEEWDAVAEAKLVRRMDLFLLPVVMLLYLLSFLDR